MIATPDNGALQQIREDDTGVFVPHEAPAELATALRRLIADPALRARLGMALQAHVRNTYSAAVVVPQWERLFAQVLDERPPAPPSGLFQSFILGGWESSTHRLRSGTRLDVIAATHHDTNGEGDYRQLSGLGIRACRDALRWHLIEAEPGATTSHLSPPCWMPRPAPARR